MSRRRQKKSPNDLGFDPRFLDGLKTPDLGEAPKTELTELKSVSLTDLSCEVTDLDQALVICDLRDDAPIDDVVKAIIFCHDAIVSAGRRTAKVAWRIGMLLSGLRERTPHGQWEKFCNSRFHNISLSTIKRYIRVAKFFHEEIHLANRTLMTAYEEAEIITEMPTGGNRTAQHIEEVTEIAKRLKSRVETLIGEHDACFGGLTAENYDDRSEMLRVFSADLGFRQALAELRSVIPVAQESDFYKRCKLLPEWLTEDKGFHYQGIDPEIIPGGVLSAEKIEELKGLQRLKATMEAQAVQDIRKPPRQTPRGFFAKQHGDELYRPKGFEPQS